jgi:hypothetical protein
VFGYKHTHQESPRNSGWDPEYQYQHTQNLIGHRIFAAVIAQTLDNGRHLYEFMLPYYYSARTQPRGQFQCTYQEHIAYIDPDNTPVLYTRARLGAQPPPTPPQVADFFQIHYKWPDFDTARNQVVFHSDINAGHTYLHVRPTPKPNRYRSSHLSQEEYYLFGTPDPDPDSESDECAVGGRYGYLYHYTPETDATGAVYTSRSVDPPVRDADGELTEFGRRIADEGAARLASCLAADYRIPDQDL